MPNSINVLEVRIPVQKIRALSDQQRYTYYLLGFIYNELLCLRKLISFTLQQLEGGDRRSVRLNADNSQTLMLFRIACAKAWEAHDKLNSKVISNVLRDDVFPIWEEGPVQLKEMNKAFGRAGWLSNMRNNLGFHYPSIDQWRPFITPTEDWVDDVIYTGAETGNLFYDASESVAKHQMFGLEDARDPDRTKQLVDDMIDLLGKMTDFVEEALGMFITLKLIDTLPPGPRHQLSAPNYTNVRIPFWIEMTKAKKRRAKR